MSDWTYSSLITKVGATLNKTNLTANIPDFITQGESVLLRRLNIRQQMQSDDYTIDGDEYPTPSGLVEVMAFSLTDPVRRLEYVTPDRFDSLNMGEGEPRFFTIVGSEFLFAPTPDQAYDAKIRYRQRLCRLSSSVRTNWLLCQHPDAYLYAALAESAPFLRDDERLPMWEARLARIIEEINDNEPRPTTRLRNDDLARHRGRFNIERGA